MQRFKTDERIDNCGDLREFVALQVSRLLIDLAAVRDSGHIDGSGRVVNDINYPVIANTKPPFLIAAP